MIKDVKQLRPELNVEGLRDFTDGEVLVHREIDVHQFRPDEGVTTHITKQVQAGILFCRRIHNLVALSVRNRPLQGESKSLCIVIDGPIRVVFEI